ncbi:MAG TPA: beta-ketoacyl synthase N-terminal-like domain-containing protein [Vicinamibacterales bacterium]|nr:beta-ketoacyl synthase N-terminal-like domain-containing protein [Vicinamibacterales bacterium]
MSRDSCLNPYLSSCERLSDKPLVVVAGAERVQSTTGAGLLRDVAAVSSALQNRLAAQERALIVLPSGLEFARALLGCISANVVAVPVPLVDLSSVESAADRIGPILRDADASVIITTAELAKPIAMACGDQRVIGLGIESLLECHTTRRAVRARNETDTALLLYTSGSTSSPKGIVLSHRELLAQSSHGAEQWRMEESSRVVCWTPMFHNVGLRFSLLAPLLKGAGSTILPAASVVQRPANWFKAIHEYRATHTAAPNFAFDMCLSHVDPAAIPEISLSSVQAIFNGGEPIRLETCTRFVERFASLGLSADALTTHYGLSEAGSVSATTPGRSVRSISLDLARLQEGVIQPAAEGQPSTAIASCGRPGRGLEVLIVNPNTCTTASSDRVGEVWISSDAVASGYLNQPQASEQAFSARVSGSEDTRYLRTGDLGFFRDSELYIAGRLKETIIVHGKNHEPSDIEQTIHRAVPALTLPIIVLMSEGETDRRLVAVMEIEAVGDDGGYDSLAREAISAVASWHGLTLDEAAFVEAGGIPRSQTGKLLRRQCQLAYGSGALPVKHTYRRIDEPLQSAATTGVRPPTPAILEALMRIVSRHVEAVARGIRPDSHLSHLGIDSLAAQRIAGEIADTFGTPCEPFLLFKHDRLDQLADYLRGDRHLDATSSAASASGAHGTGSAHSADEMRVAVVGVSCHFPGHATDPEAFWRNQVSGLDCVAPITESRSSHLGAGDGGGWCEGRESRAPGGFIDGVATFDAEFFGVTRREAESMDPQQRKLLELTWSAIESAGHNPRAWSGRDVGVFVGARGVDYLELVVQRQQLLQQYGSHLDAGLHSTMIANRVSRWFDFCGPSEVVNTACSSSLVALQHAVAAISHGDCSAAVVAGINLNLSPGPFIRSRRSGILGNSGQCRTFSADADGCVRGEGYGAVVLRPYADALRDGDVIHALIRGVAVNHDGRSLSVRAPTVAGQRRLLERAYRTARVPVESVTYIETNGTGTPIGDAIEIEALKEAFRALNPDSPAARCGLGSVKTNIGHCESAAGIAGLIKVLLAMKHGTLPGLLHLTSLNPAISLQSSPFYIVTETMPWPRLQDAEGREIPRRAGVSSFGFGGANAHVIVEEHMPAEPSASRTRPPLSRVLLSARSHERLVRQAERLLAAIRSGAFGDGDLPDIAYTLQFGRELMENRVTFDTLSLDDLDKKLTAFADGRPSLDEAVDVAVADSQAVGHRRVTLPTYPFAETPYWFSTSAESDRAVTEDAPTAGFARRWRTLDIDGDTFAPPSVMPQKAGDSASLEEWLRLLWAKVLEVERVEPDDDFLALGGDSIRAAEIAALIQERLHVVIQFSDLLEHPTIAALAGKIRG